MLKLFTAYSVCLLVLFIAVPLFARSKEDAEYAPPPGVLTGTVLDAQSRAPIRGLVVIATSPSLDETQHTTTDASGRYRLPLLPAGTYALRFEHPDYASHTRADLLLRSNQTEHLQVELLPR
ncbi:carboxypeptidase-like regulatory domain-containing protein [Myxococcus landrumensis]|uniref:Carboxypeptidase regulatory-like domain-containing protein n=1 Tax=Myxococcus landrumensis TaxID=2813577 RepID=A0ABX7MZY4_9BACT|nr:carboxypeptidase-like regulatory domain-containing protein [Myxococcus landrumus]QSQ12015.1 carboxypeptidase regulatory-like domain-containing protein [Myxococcus landrumus]